MQEIMSRRRDLGRNWDYTSWARRYCPRQPGSWHLGRFSFAGLFIR